MNRKVASNISAILLILSGCGGIENNTLNYSIPNLCNLPKEPALSFNNRKEMREWYLYQANEMLYIPTIQSFLKLLIGNRSLENLILSASYEQIDKPTNSEEIKAYRLSILEPYDGSYKLIATYINETLTLQNEVGLTESFNPEISEDEKEILNTFTGFLYAGGNKGLAPQDSVYVFELQENCLTRVDSNYLLGTIGPIN